MSGWSDIRAGVVNQRNRLVESLGSPEQRQLALLAEIVERNRDTVFGRRFGFADIRTVSDYQQRVPLHGYDDIRADIDRMTAGEADVLCADDVLLFEQTGGSGGGSKTVPFTRPALDAIRSAVLPWLDDLLCSRPGIAEGRAYWAISPVARSHAHTAGGVPIGIDNDAAYFGEALAQAIAGTLAVPASVAAIRSVDDWRFVTLHHLLACRDLSFVSVWSPTFLLQLMDAIRDDIERLAAAVDGQHADPARASELRRLFAGEDVRWDRVWPRLDTISCWSSASSRRYANELADRFPQTLIQGKGLLATEGVVTVPLTGSAAPVLAVNSAFFEFESEDGDIVLPWNLETGGTYSVVLTTLAGLYRYRLGDKVEVRGWCQASPCLEYVGRAGGSDLCGEKLTEGFVEATLGDLPGFGLLVPIENPRPRYLLLLDEAIVGAGETQQAASVADGRLMQNPQYRYARELGQLPPPEPRRISDPLATYQRICVQHGQRLGDIKPTVLVRPWWGEEFLGSTVS